MINIIDAHHIAKELDYDDDFENGGRQLQNNCGE